MNTYTVKIEFEIDADTPEQAAHTLADWIDEGLYSRPVCDVVDEHGETTRIDTEEELA